MKLEDIAKLLKSTGFPVAYWSFEEKKAPPMPFICYMVAYSNNFGADNTVYQKINHIQVELYTKYKEPQAEEKVEKALSSFYWEKTETYIDTQSCRQILYEIEVL